MIESALVDVTIQMLMKGLVDKIDAEVQYVVGFEHEFEKMKSQLVSLQSYLGDVDRHKEKYETLKDASAKLQDLIYRIDDLVIDCQNRVEYEKMKNSYFSSISLRGIYFRNQIGKKLAEINRDIVSIHQTLNIIPSMVSLVRKREELVSSGSERIRWTSDIIDESQIVGLAEDTRTLKEWILPFNGSLQLIGIVGMGGVGKTTLAQKIYNDREVFTPFKVKIWVCKSTFGELEIMQSIVKQLTQKDPGSDRIFLLQTIHEQLSNKKYLIVMDDVWKIDGWWKRIFEGLPKTEKQNSCIIITSRNEDVVRRMGVEKEQIHRPKVLSEEEGWLLFCKVAFTSSKGKCKDTKLEHVGKDILKKCGGLPLAIKTIGGLLSSKSQLISVWQEVCTDLPQILANESKSHDSLMATLQLSYNELSLQLKQCILCFAIYPEDYEIEVDQLANWWIGEGFIYKKGKTIARKMALECLSELISRCLVEAVRKRNYDGRVYSCKMHDLVRDMIIRVAKEESFCSLDENNTNIATKNSRRMGVTTALLEPLAGNSKLRALLLIKAYCMGFTRQVALAQVKSLRVLDLSHIKFEESSQFCEKDMWRWITSSKRLAYLSFREVANLTKLPKSIKKLWGLQILVLGECKDLKQLPKSITLLSKLIVLDVGNCTSLSYLPRGLSKLSHLQELYGFKIPDATIPNACNLRDLKDLRELRVLQLDFIDGSKIEEDELTVLEEFQYLRMLIVNAGDRRDDIFLERMEKLSPPKSLEELYLRHFSGHTTPAWIAPELLDRLLYLCIEESSVLQHMSNRFRGSAGNKWKIEGLCLKCLPNLEETWDGIKNAMPGLKYVEVSHCNSLKSFKCSVKSIGFWREPEEENEEPNVVPLMEGHHHKDEMN